MSALLVCDGCGTEFDTRHQIAITGRRSDGALGGGLPNGDFDLCNTCAKLMFAALKRETR